MVSERAKKAVSVRFDYRSLRRFPEGSYLCPCDLRPCHVPKIQRVLVLPWAVISGCKDFEIDVNGNLDFKKPCLRFSLHGGHLHDK